MKIDTAGAIFLLGLILSTIIMVSCTDYTRNAKGWAADGSIESCQKACRAIGAPNWGFALTGGHFTGCMCIGQVPQQDGGCQ